MNMNQDKVRRFALSASIVLVLQLSSGIVSADFTTFSNGFGSKWGDPVYGTPSDSITWSFMNDELRWLPTTRSSKMAQRV